MLLRHRLFRVFIVLAGLARSGHGYAAETETVPLVSDLRLGLLAHDPWSRESGAPDLHGEILFTPFGHTRSLIPKAHIGFSLNSAGKTSHLHAGLTWRFDLTARLFAEIGLGAALHNGSTGPRVAPDRNALGCPILLRESLGMGWRIDRHWHVMARFEHLSNGGLCTKNRGLTNLGLQLGYAF